MLARASAEVAAASAAAIEASRPAADPPLENRAGGASANTPGNSREANLLVHYPDLFTPQGVEAIKRDLSRIPPHAAELSSGLRTDYRRVTTRDFGVGYNWIIDPIVDVVVAANDQAYGFHIDGVAEGLNYLVYESTGDQYKRHIDIHMADLNSNRANRKLTYVLQLSEPDEYEGCDLVLDGGADAGMPIPRDCGGLSIFPAFMAHEVTPLVRGARHSIVGWVHGDAWR